MKSESRRSVVMRIARDVHTRFQQLERECMVVITPDLVIRITTLGTGSEYSVKNAYQMYHTLVTQYGVPYEHYVEALVTEFEMGMICEDVFVKYYAGSRTILSN